MRGQQGLISPRTKWHLKLDGRAELERLREGSRLCIQSESLLEEEEEEKEEKEEECLPCLRCFCFFLRVFFIFSCTFWSITIPDPTIPGINEFTGHMPRPGGGYGEG